jgi:hypothetical protein
VSEVAHAAGQRAAAEYLRQLLLKPGRYRDAWQQLVVRHRDGVGAINQMAVAEVLSLHKRSGHSSLGDTDALSWQLKTTVSDALSGRLLNRPVLSLFIDAFGFSEHETDKLWRLWNGSATISVLSGSHAVSAHTEREVAQLVGPRNHQTLSLHDHVWVGSDRRGDRARMLQVIEATAAGVDRIPFVCDTNVLTIEVRQGCKEVRPLRQLGADAFLTEILLARTLDVGETTSLEFWLTYQNPGDPDDPQEREYRRAVLRHMENYDVRVEFHPDQLPTRVWWARWDGVEGDVAEQEEVFLDAQHAVHRYLRSLSKTVVGFRWEWD